MQHQDYLTRQVEQMGKALAKAISDLFGLKSKGEVSESIRIVDTALRTEVDLDMAALMALPESELIERLRGNVAFSNENLESFSDLLTQMGIRCQSAGEPAEAHDTFQKAIAVLELADEQSEVFSLVRDGKKNRLKTMINHL